MMYGPYGTYYVGYGISILGGLITLIFIILVVLFLVWIVREISGRHGGSHSRALEILRIRYAKGEINKEEYDTKMKELS